MYLSLQQRALQCAVLKKSLLSHIIVPTLTGVMGMLRLTDTQ